MTHADPPLPELSVCVARTGGEQRFLSSDFVVPCATKRLEKLFEGTFM